MTSDWEAFTRPRWSERHGVIVVTVLVTVCLILLALVPANGQ